MPAVWRWGHPGVVGYFGSIGAQLDWKVYLAVAAAGYPVKMNGLIARGFQPPAQAGIEYVTDMPYEQLPVWLSGIDACLLAYLGGPRTDGVMPAKFFECLATGKPLVTCGLPEAKRYGDCVTCVDGGPGDVLDALRRIRGLSSVELQERRRAVARRAGWDARFREFLGGWELEWRDRRTTSILGWRGHGEAYVAGPVPNP